MVISPQRPVSSPPKLINLLAVDWNALLSLMKELGWPAYRAKQIFRWLYRVRIQDIDQMTDLSIGDRSLLKTIGTIQRMNNPTCLTGEDGTRKYLFPVDNGLQVESVAIPEGKRLTLCLSTQVGCTLDCTFCLTGQMGLKRNLKAHEIVDQVLTVQDQLNAGEKLTSLVLMGMGEPLANLEAVCDAVFRLTQSGWGMGFPPRRITLSTAGLASRINEIAALGINLAISLNATTNEQRSRLMPVVNDLHPLPELLAACRDYPLAPGRRLTFEYVLLGGMNDSIQDAKRLLKLLQGIRCKINLIPFNEFPGSSFKRPGEESIEKFQSILRRGGFDVFIRKSRGSDVLGACGQLGNLMPSRNSR